MLASDARQLCAAHIPNNRQNDMKAEFRVKLRQKYHTNIQRLAASKKRKFLTIGQFIFKEIVEKWNPTLRL